MTFEQIKPSITYFQHSIASKYWVTKYKYINLN